jgi:hypothetical protein
MKRGQFIKSIGLAFPAIFIPKVTKPSWGTNRKRIYTSKLIKDPFAERVKYWHEKIIKEMEYQYHTKISDGTFLSGSAHLTAFKCAEIESNMYMQIEGT